MKRYIWIPLFVSSVAAPCATRAQELSAAKRTALESVDAIRGQIGEMSSNLWQWSETALREHQSADYLSTTLEREGFRVERGVAQMPTAFIASYGSGRPIIGILAEYDALPGVGNAATPYRQLRPDSVTSGQGCGHNLFGAGSVGAALALKRVMDQHGLPGTIRLYGTPAEETVVGKVYMAKAGVFDDLDAALEWHPGLETGVNNNPGRAMNSFTVSFHGQAAHASADPWNGRSAVDAVEMMNYGVNLMREHVQPTARIHYVMPSAGDVPNVVPDYAQVWYFVRDLTRETVDEYYAWILDIAEGAAGATRTTHDVSLITGVHEMLLNRPLLEVVQRNLDLVGSPAFPEEFHQFAREMQAALEIEESGLFTDIKELAPEPEPASGGSTDVAEVSYITPTAGLSVATAPQGVPWHSWATAAAHGTPGAIEGAVVAAKVLALTGVDLLTDGDLRRRAREFFTEATDGQPYQSPIPADQSPPIPSR